MIGVREVEHVAKLARLTLSQQEKGVYAAQLAKVIGYFDEIEAVQTSGVEPMAHALSITNVMRFDEAMSPPGQDLIMSNAPDRENGLFKVPRISE